MCMCMYICIGVQVCMWDWHVCMYWHVCMCVCMLITDFVLMVRATTHMVHILDVYVCIYVFIVCMHACK
jgi:hypothetical protein